MARPTLEVKLSEKTLSVNGVVFNLDDSFFGAELARILNGERGYALKLKYHNKELNVMGEGERLYEFLQERWQADGLEAYDVPAPETDRFPLVEVTGEYEATIRA